jgi:FkbM family methyltransferase
VSSFWSKPLAAAIRRHHRHPLVQAGAGVARWYLRCVFNERYWNFRDNGELHLLRTLADHYGAASTTVFDVGANVGDYASSVVATMPRARVHCFEIVPATRDRLRRRLSALPQCVVAGCGLSNAVKCLDIGSRHEFDTDARLISPLLERFSMVASCDVTTGDEYLQAHDIFGIHLLKIDTEGHDMSVMEGFAGAIRAGRVAVIQFEYGTTWIPYRKFLHDAYSLLSPAGYCLGRLYPHGVDFKPYNRVRDDHFRMGNYVAVHHTHHQLVARLSLSPGVKMLVAESTV